MRGGSSIKDAATVTLDDYRQRGELPPGFGIRMVRLDPVDRDAIEDLLRLSAPVLGPGEPPNRGGVEQRRELQRVEPERRVGDHHG